MREETTSERADVPDHVRRRDPIQGDIIHEYDGIEEADNHLPTWWLWTFYGAIAFGVLYWFYYEEFEIGPTTGEEYAAAVAARASGGEADLETLLALSQDPSTIEAGRDVFATTCAACHGDRAQGEIGPNLTDDHWLHGGGPMEIYASVRSGIDSDAARIPGSAGMPGWGPLLGDDRVNAVSAYLLSIRGENLEGRPAEGEIYDPSAP